MQEFEPVVQGSEPVDLQPGTNPAAAEALPHTDLNRDQAEHLLQSVFGEGLETSAEFFDELQAEAFRSDHVAVVAAPEPGGSAGLLASVLPLRVENEDGEKEVVDLDLERVGDHLEPENPLVQLEIPNQLSEGIALPGTGVSIDIGAQDVDRSASEVGEASAFYPNVATDSDLVVAAAPTGFETYTHLRSPDAPRKEVFNLTLPGEAILQETAEGGAEVIGSDDSILLTVGAPSAVDAEGTPVPAALEVSGNSIVVSAAPVSETAYPVLVDPLFEYYNFNYSSDGGAAGADWHRHADPGFGTPWGGPNYGMTAHSWHGATAPGHQGQWNYHVPRFWTDTQAGLPMPTTYIRNLKLWNLTFMTPEELGVPVASRAVYPFMQMWLWSQTMQQFVAFGKRYGNEGQWTDGSYVFNLINPNENTDVKHGGFGLATWNSWNSAYRYVNAQQASVEITETDIPAFGELGAVSRWVNNQPGAPIKYKVSDPGLGIHRLNLSYPAASGGWKQLSTSIGCVGTASSACPRTASDATKPISYHPAVMPQGENWVEITAVDPVNNVSSPGVSRIKVDHTPPALSLAGNLTEQATAGTELPEYTLNYSASDGDEAAPAARAPIGSSGSAPGQMQGPIGVEVDSNGNVWSLDRINRRVQKFSPAGSLLAEFPLGSIPEGPVAEARDLAVTPSGNIWVSDAATKRIIGYSPQGQVLGKFGHSSFVHPFGLAEGLDGSVWVTDLGSGSVYKFSAAGSLLKQIKSVSGVQFTAPLGIDSDAFGGIWVAERASNKIVRLEPDGSSAIAFGGPGPGDGQLLEPAGLAVAPSGNILVVDSGNNRVQVFRPLGTFLQKFGAFGAGNSQLSGARGIAVAPDGSAYIADGGNQRIARWEHADKDPQSGVAKVEIKVDGATVHTNAPGCEKKNCALSGSWNLAVNDYSGGSHKVEVIATDEVGLQTPRVLNIETHGDGTAPALSLTGSLAQQDNHGTTLPRYRLIVNATDPGSVEELKSGVASTVIAIDGKVVDQNSPGCLEGGCEITREWILKADDYAVGPHTAKVTATDEAGHTTVKTFAFSIARDTTAPVFDLSGDLYTAPKGWVEQGPYSYFAMARDEKGYGITSMTLKVGGEVVAAHPGASCAFGGCLGFLGFFESLDMAEYDGGAYPAELIATDGAGNWRKKVWTINVVPKGNVSPSEAADTLEAAEATSELNPLSEPSEELNTEEGVSSELSIASGDDSYEVSGTMVPTFIGEDPADGVTMHILEDGSLSSCAEPSVNAPPSEGMELNSTAADEACPESVEEGDSQFYGLESAEVTPVAIDTDATPNVEANGGAAALAANTGPSVDTVTRPLFDGTQAFMAIRDQNAPRTYSWRVSLDSDQELRLLDPKHAAVYYEGERLAFSITAVEAHDAIGTSVPTKLSVDGDVLTLHVAHQGTGPEGQAFVYPVVGGTGWQGGFQTYEVEMPPPTETEEESPGEEWEAEASNRYVTFRISSFGPPEAWGSDQPQLEPKTSQPIDKKFKFTVCHSKAWPNELPEMGPDPKTIPPIGRRDQLPHALSECQKPAVPGVWWAVSVHGWFHYKYRQWVWIKPSEFSCGTKWGPEQPALVHCKARLFEKGTGPANAVRGPINVIGQYRFPPGVGNFIAEAAATCATIGGKLHPNPRRAFDAPYERPLIYSWRYRNPYVDCDWD